MIIKSLMVINNHQKGLKEMCLFSESNLNARMESPRVKIYPSKEWIVTQNLTNN